MTSELIAREGCQQAPSSRNLTDDSRLGRFIRHPALIRTLQLFSLALLLLALGIGLFGEDKRTSLTLLLFWGIFWPLLTCVTTPLLGPVFCALCPHGTLGRWITRFGLKKRFPKALRGAWIGLGLMLIGYWAFVFSVPRVLSVSSQVASWYFIGFTLLALVSFLIYADMAYCKHLCPLGRVLTVHGKAGGLRIQTRQSECRSCRTFECAKACHYHLSPFRFEALNNSDSCTLCMDCVQACESVDLHWQTPGSALSRPIQKADRHDLWVLLLMLAVAGVAIQFRHGLQRTGLRDQLPWNQAGEWLNQVFSIAPMTFNFSGLLGMLTAIAIVLPLSLLAYARIGRLLHKPTRQVAADLAYALAPVAILGLSAHAIRAFITSYWHALINESAALLGLAWKIAPLAQRGDAWLKLTDLLLYLGILWGLWLVWQRLRHWNLSGALRWRIWAWGCTPIWLYGAVVAIKLLALLLLPVPPAHP